ncbi:palmitoyltransferase ZDHHC11 [Patella vulgata]|uniref:palmitoyltransferase ZDHHC11 n=1 Tax=Patella vulgata TaxID=6465 RepID=UPI0024A9976F|nr:palmitoyltransferase ZDHHC11 [Patella vulgata]
MPPESTIYRESSRRNGWSLPPHPLQFIAWLVVIFFVFIYFTTLVPALTLNWQPAAYIINGIGCLIHIISHFVAASINPADSSVVKKNNLRPSGTFDRQKHRHVIENQYCYLCEVNVGPKSKHCSACNKCIAGFDHHCKWLNNCVGSNNYKWFIATLVSGLVGTAMVFCVSLVEFIGYFTDKDDGKILFPYQDTINQTLADFKLVYGDVSDTVWIGIVGATGILGLLALLLLIHLFSFHVYLLCKGMSTYDYIVRMRDREGLRNMDEPKYVSPRNKGNRVTPSKSKATGATMLSEGIKPSKQERRELQEYRKALEEKEKLEDGETPPPSSSPIRQTEVDGSRNTDSETKIKKLKRRKRKSLSTEKERQEIATIDNQSMYKTPIYNERPLPKSNSTHQRKLPIPKQQLLVEDDLDSEESMNEVNHNKSVDRQSHDSGAYMTGGHSNYSSPASIHSPTSTNNNNHIKKTKKKKRKPTPQLFSDEESNNDLNSTTMFTVNETAKFNRDGSLDYSNGFQNLPLTPIQMRKRPKEIPPLDLSMLRSSTESQNTFKPYSGGLRDSDTYRYLDREKNSNPLLQSVPELGGDTEL